MTNTVSWQPTASLDHLRARAQLLAAIRQFFADRQVLEVETPLLSQAAATDVHLASVAARLTTTDGVRDCYLHTSPEFAMKRLLAAGSGPIYQLCKVFRDGERGRKHNPEFSMLEWYRPGFTLAQLIQEVADLVGFVCGSVLGVQTRSYRDAFLRRIDLDPHTASLGELRDTAARLGLTVELGVDRLAWLDLLFSHVVEPTLGYDAPLFLTDFPAAMASLAQVRQDEHGNAVASRFELYIEGLELANGYHELGDAGEQAQRFAADNERRAALGLPRMPEDRFLLAALAAGFPDSCGVALGVDRLAMVLLNARRIEQVVTFPQERA